MQISLSPKAMFQQQEEIASAWRTVAAGTLLRTAILYTMSEMASSHSMSAEQSKAINDFAYELLNLGEPAPTPTTLPSRTISMSDPAAKLRK